MKECSNCDVVVVGSGLAGMICAITAAQNGARVHMAVNGKCGYSGSSFYPKSLPWGILSSGSGERSDEIFYNETITASQGCLDAKLVKRMVENSNDVLKMMQSWGIAFEDHEKSGEVPCFGKTNRGHQLLNLESARTAYLQEMRISGVKMIEDFHAIDLLVYRNQCFGVVGFNADQELLQIRAKATVLATGGAESLFRCGLSNPAMTGEGYAMALRNGAQLTNMEFIQFIPASTGPVRGINFHHTTLASQPEITDQDGRELIRDYLPQGITKEECLSLRSTHGPFSNEDNSRYFDLSMVKSQRDPSFPKGFQVHYNESLLKEARYRQWIDYLKSQNIDFMRSPIEIYPHAQGFNGGILIDEFCRTGIQGMFACGEVSGGQHGANRMGGNAILDTQVFGIFAGKSAAAYAATAHVPPVTYRLGRIFDTGNKSKLSMGELKEEIKSIMQKSACVARNGNDIAAALGQLNQLQSLWNPMDFPASDLKEAISLSNQLTTAKAVLSAIDARKESRGSHCREDYPEKQFGMEKVRFIIIQNQNKEIAIRRENLAETP